MKWMGGWTYADLRACPHDLLPLIVEMMHEEQKAFEHGNNSS